MNTTALKRLSIKTDQQTLIMELQRDYRLSPVESKVLFTRLQEYLSEHQHDYLADGQIIYPAVAFSEPAGRPLEQCQLIRVRLTLDAPEDVDALSAGGTPFLRKLRLFRISFEAVDQGARLAQEDFTRLLGVDRSTVQRIIATYRDENVFIPTRGQSKDIGPGVSHKVYVVEMFLNFATFSEISRRLGEKVSGLRRYVRDFASVLCAYDMDLSLEKIRVITGLSSKLVKEYIELIERFDRPEYQTILPMKPIVLTFLTEDDVSKHIQTKGREQRLALLRDRMARMLKESQQQAGPLAQSDLAAFFSFSPAMISKHLKKWQQENSEYFTKEEDNDGSFIVQRS